MAAYRNVILRLGARLGMSPEEILNAIAQEVSTISPASSKPPSESASSLHEDRQQDEAEIKPPLASTSAQMYLPPRPPLCQQDTASTDDSQLFGSALERRVQPTFALSLPPVAKRRETAPPALSPFAYPFAASSGPSDFPFSTFAWSPSAVLDSENSDALQRHPSLYSWLDEQSTVSAHQQQQHY